MYEYVHFGVGSNITLEMPQPAYGTIDSPMYISSRLELYVQPDGHIWTWLKTHIPPGLARTQYPAVRLYQGHMTSSLSLVIDFVH